MTTSQRSQHFVAGTIEGPNGTTREKLTLAALALRCAKLLLAVTEFAQQRRFGEVIPIVARSLFESALKLGWMSLENTADAVNRFVAFGLRTERELERFIRAEIERNGRELPVERRMLESVERTFRLSQMSETEIFATKKLPDMASMADRVLGGRLPYITLYEITSHAAHGTWVDVLYRYTGPSDDGGIQLYFGAVPPDMESLISSGVVVTVAVEALVHATLGPSEAETLRSTLRTARTQLVTILHEFSGDDYKAG